MTLALRTVTLVSIGLSLLSLFFGALQVNVQVYYVTELPDEQPQDETETTLSVTQQPDETEPTPAEATTTTAANLETSEFVPCGDWLPFGNPGHANYSATYKTALSEAFPSCLEKEGTLLVGQKFRPDARRLHCQPNLTAHDRQPAYLALDLQLRQEQPQFTVVSPSFNVEKVLSVSAPPICQHTQGVYELLFVLDGCYDHSLQALKEVILSDECAQSPHLTRARVLCQPGSIFETSSDNLGFLLGNPSHFYLEIQSDMLLKEPGWNLDIARPFLEHDDLFSLSGRCGHDIQNIRTGHMGRCKRAPTLDSKLKADTQDGFYFKPTNNRGPVIYRADALQKLGFLDEVNYYLGGDDHDINVRATFYGLKAAYKYIAFEAPYKLSPQRNKELQGLPLPPREKAQGKAYRSKRKREFGSRSSECPPTVKDFKGLLTNVSLTVSRPPGWVDQLVPLQSKVLEQWKGGRLPPLPPLTDRISVEYPMRCKGKACKKKES